MHVAEAGRGSRVRGEKGRQQASFFNTRAPPPTPTQPPTADEASLCRAVKRLATSSPRHRDGDARLTRRAAAAAAAVVEPPRPVAATDPLSTALHERVAGLAVSTPEPEITPAPDDEPLPPPPPLRPPTETTTAYAAAYEDANSLLRRLHFERVSRRGGDDAG